MFQGEAQDAQARMDSIDEHTFEGELSFWYWRGVRDAFETAAFELYVELGDIPRPTEFVVMVVT